MVDLYDLAFAKNISGGGTPAPEPILITKNITANGTYNAASDNADGYSGVTVNVPEIAMPDYIKNGLRIFIQPNTIASSSNVPVIGKESVFAIDENESLDLSNGVSISMVFKLPSNYSDSEYTWNKLHEAFLSNGSRIMTAIRWSGSAARVILNAYTRTNSDDGAARDVATVELGKYVHITTVYLFDNDRTVKFYVNGILAYTATGVGSSTSYLSGAIVNQFSIMENCYTAGTLASSVRHPPYSTYLDCALYDRILTDQEIATNFNAANETYHLVEE